MQSKLLILQLKSTEVTTEHQKWSKICKNQHKTTYSTPHKNAKLQHKMDLRQNSVCSEQNIYPRPKKNLHKHCLRHLESLYHTTEELYHIIKKLSYIIKELYHTTAEL